MDPQQSPAITTPQHPTFSPNNHNSNSPRPSTQPTDRLSPILTSRQINNPISPEQPQYAETLTPLKLRRKRRHAALQSALPPSVPLTPGPSLQGYTTEDGEVFRGATYDPRTGPPALDEDALTLGGTSTTSSSSSWSWASDINRGRRATMAVIGRFGERLGVRRGSNSSSSDSDTDTTRSRSISVSRRRSRRLSRTTTKDSTTSDRPKRQHLPKKREFTLLFPPKDPLEMDITSLSLTTTPQGSLHSADDSPPLYPPERLISTPSLPTILDHIRALRLAAGILPEPPSVDGPVRRGHGGYGHGHGRQRPKIRHGHQSFPNPPLPRAAPVYPKSRLEALRAGSQPQVPRPKSVSDLMGMMNPYGSSASLNTLKAEYKNPSPTSSLSGAKDEPRGDSKGCWWLDVSCPGWEDLRDIGEVLGLHPLTLEDVLQQDPREKFDVFDRLGYYFVVVRALDEEYFKYTPGSATTLVGVGEKPLAEPSPDSSPQLRANNEKKKEGRRRGWGMGRTAGKATAKEGEKVEIVEDNPGKEGLEGVGVGAVNLYLVVFADGIVSFHFEDITKHTKRVLDRILSSASIQAAPGADWIAHGLLDSIVDAFFPLIRYVDGEVDDIDSMTIDPSVDPRAVIRAPPVVDSPGDFEMNEKGYPSAPPVKRPPYTDKIKDVIRSIFASMPLIHLPRPFLYLGLFFLPTTSAVRNRYSDPDDQAMPRSDMVRHITHTRKLVTGLTRLLGAKHQVVGLMRKRVAENSEGVEVYLGDVEDHILLLQNSLLHYEYILSHCQPAYLSHLSLNFKIAKGRSDRAILALSTVAIGVLPMQLVTTLFGVNVNVPHNGDPDDWHNRTNGTFAPLGWFIGILIFMAMVTCAVVFTVRWWRWSARVKFAKQRGEGIPSTWDGFWGFK